MGLIGGRGFKHSVFFHHVLSVPEHSHQKNAGRRRNTSAVIGNIICEGNIIC